MNRPSRGGGRGSWSDANTTSRKRPAETQEAAWVADEDRFVLQQAKKKAQVRVKEGRAKPIDWLAVTLRFIDPSRNSIEDEVSDAQLDVVDPEGVFEGLDDAQLEELGREIDTYLALERTQSNTDFWETMHTICRDRQRKNKASARNGRGVESVSADVDRLFNSKTLEELQLLEQQIKTKLQSDAAIDVDYWESLLRSLQSWKARAKLRKVSQSVVESRMKALRQQQATEAQEVSRRLTTILRSSASQASPLDPAKLDPEPLLKLREEDKSSQIQDEGDLLKSIARERQRVLKLGYVPERRKRDGVHDAPKAATAPRNDEATHSTSLQYEREVARGIGEDEEVFNGEEEVSTAGKQQWTDKYRPRKPRYFNRVQMGYEWNKYNQTHYDHDNPPPKVVQGYKFNVFYPELIDRSKAPTYKIEREDGRKRGQTFAPAGEEDTCLIRFVAGPPYEDIAFRIVDREWDYSAKRDRGFRSSFDKGVLQLHFQFKKIFYRK